jgi:hypothetical protein
VRLDRSRGGRARGIRVPHADALGITAAEGEQAEQFAVDRRPLAWGRGRVRLQRLDAPAQRGRQHLLDLAERAERGVLGAAQAGRRLRAQAHRDRDALVVGEQERRQPGARLEPVAARHAAGRLDAVAELAQPLDVAAQRAIAHAEPVHELARGPVPVALQQREQFERPRGGRGHASILAA